MSDLTIIPSFDYSALPTDAAATVRELAVPVHKFTARITSDIVEVGDALMQAKEAVGHDRFGTWLEAEFGMHQRTARRYMLAARWARGKSDTVTLLEPAAVYVLS